MFKMIMFVFYFIVLALVYPIMFTLISINLKV